MSVNKVILRGHVGGDPELRFPEKDVAGVLFFFVPHTSPRAFPTGKTRKAQINLVFFSHLPAPQAGAKTVRAVLCY